MAKIVWSKLAIRDLESIHDFIAKDSLVYAQKTVEGFFTRVEILSDFPEAGREVPEYMRKEIRELIEGNYRIFYKISPRTIFIIRVHHSSRKLRRHRVSSIE